MAEVMKKWCVCALADAVERWCICVTADAVERWCICVTADAEKKGCVRRIEEGVRGCGKCWLTLFQFAHALARALEGRSRAMRNANTAMKLRNSPRIGQSDLFMPSLTAFLYSHATTLNQ